MKKINLDTIYKTALSASKKVVSECRDFSDITVKDNVFYGSVSFKKILVAIIEVALPIAMFMFKDLAMEYIMLFFDEFNLAYPVEYISMAYNIIAIMLFGYGGYSLAKMLMTIKEKGASKKIQTLANRLEEETKNILPEFDKQINEAIEKGEDLVFEPATYWQVELNEYKNKFSRSQKQYNKILQIIGTILCVGAVLFAGKFFFPYIVEGFAGGYGSTSGYIVFSSYLILTMVLATALMNLCSWYSKIAQYVTSGLFAAYQVLVIISLNRNYHVFDAFVAAIQSKDVDIILENCVFNYTVIAMLLVTAATIWMLLTTRFDLIKDARRNGFTVPMEPPANDVQLTAEKVQNMLIIKGILATVATMLTGAWMASVIEKGFSFGGIISFLVIAVVWSIISGSLESDVTRAVYNKFSKFLYLMHYIGYVIIILSATPEFGWGTLVLLVVHFLSLFVVAFALAILGLF